MKVFLDSVKKIISDSPLVYLALISGISAIAIVSFQLQRGELNLNPLGTGALLFVSIMLFFGARRYCNREAFKLSFLGTMYVIVAYLAWPTRYSWAVWHDQGYFLRMTSELSQGYLTNESFFTGVGYPLLAAPFYRIIGNDSLFIPNLFAFAGTIYFSFLLFRLITNDSVAKITVLFLMFATTFASYYIVWWNNGIVIFSLVLATYLSTKPPRTRNLLIIGFLVGYSFFTRYADVVLFLPMLFYVVWRAKMKGLIFAVAGALPMILATLYTHWIVFGDFFRIPYRFQTAPFRLETIPHHAFLTILYYPADLALSDPAVGVLKMPILIGTFFFMMAPLGAYILWKSKIKRDLLLVLTTTIILTVLYSSSYYQFHSGSFGQFPADFRYTLPAYPYLVLLSVIGLLSLIGMYQTQAPMRMHNLQQASQTISSRDSLNKGLDTDED